MTNDNTFVPVTEILKNLSGPSYITDSFSDLGVDELIILSGVFRADTSYLGVYFARALYKKPELYKEKRVLDLGSGCGLLGLITALNGASSVHFSDINPVATKNSHLNAILHDVADKCTFSYGSLFEGIPNTEQFDVIIFNPPVIAGETEEVHELAVVRDDTVVPTFYDKVREYLAPGGVILMPTSSRFTDEYTPNKMAARHNFTVEILNEQEEEGNNLKQLLRLT